jgi:hypothetical protein
MSKIFQRYGKNFRITEKIQGQKSSEAKTVTFTDLVTLRKNDNKKKLISIERKPIENDPFHIVEPNSNFIMNVVFVALLNL